MSATVVNLVRSGFYLDSVALMRLSSVLSEREGVGEVVLMIGTETNKGIMRAAGVRALRIVSSSSSRTKG